MSGREDRDRRGDLVAGKYRLDACLGAGGMGAVYRAHHEGVARNFAVKLLHAEVAKGPDARARFRREAQAAGKVSHPGLLEVFDVGETERGELYMVMELLEGESLAERIARAPLSEGEARALTRGLLEPLAAAHAAGVLHRDVKPGNVFLVGRDATRVKVLDFGIARFLDEEGGGVTTTGDILGSPLYMAPEQARGDRDLDARVDVWAVGATLYEVLARTPAFGAPTAVAVLTRVLTGSPTPLAQTAPGAPADLVALVERALDRDRARAFADAGAMLRALDGGGVATGDDRVRTDVPVTRTSDPALAPTLAVASEARRRGSRSTALWGGGGLALGALAVAAVLGVRSRTAEDAQAPATREPLAGVLAKVAPPANAAPAEPAEPGATPASGAPAGGSAGPAIGAAPAGSGSATQPAAPTAPSATTTPSAKPPAPGSKPAAPPAPAAATTRCAAGQIASHGHCCPRGMVWHETSCDRPLATELD